MTRRIRWLLLIALLYGLVEAGSLLGLWLLSAVSGVRYAPLRLSRLTERQEEDLDRLLGGDPGYLAHHPVLGWTIRRGGGAGGYQASAQGVRGDREYAPLPPQGVVRLAAFGDSFTHGDEVTHEETWAARLEALEPRREVLNFGVPAYGVDQALLRYREEGRALRPHVVLIGFMSENPHRHVNVFRPFYSPLYEFVLAKPRFALQGDRLVLRPNPLPRLEDYRLLGDEPEGTLRRLGANDHFFHLGYEEGPWDLLPSVRAWKIARHEVLSRLPSRRILLPGGRYDTASEAYRITTLLIDDFVREALEDGALPLVLLFPNRQDLERGLHGRPPAYAPLRERLGKEKLRFLDLLPALGEEARTRGMDVLFAGAWSHYSPRAHDRIAREIDGRLRAEGWVEVPAIRRAVEEERAPPRARAPGG